MATANPHETARPAPVRPGPVLIGGDGTPPSPNGLRGLLPRRQALIVTVWKAGLGVELIALPGPGIGLPPAPVDVSAALEVGANAHPVLLFREPTRHPA